MYETSFPLPRRRREAPSKTRLLEAGIRLFTQNAGAGLTSRELAREAQVNHSLISYHFGGMANFMDAVVDQCLQELRAMLIPELARLEQCVKEDAAPETLRGHMAAVLGMLSGPKGQALVQALNSPDSASLQGVYSKFGERVLQPLHHAFLAVAATYRAVPEDSLEAAIVAQLMVSQAMAFFRGAGQVLAHLDKEKFTPEDAREITRLTTEALCRSAGIVG